MKTHWAELEVVLRALMAVETYINSVIRFQLDGL